MPLDMNPEVRSQWCQALRSGEYKQGKHRLLTIDGTVPDVGDPDTAEGERTYCCLGVLTDLAVKAGVITWAEVIRGYGNGTVASPVADWAGLAHKEGGNANPVIGHDSYGHIQATGANDAYAWDFSQIADAICGKS